MGGQILFSVDVPVWISEASTRRQADDSNTRGVKPSEVLQALQEGSHVTDGDTVEVEALSLPLPGLRGPVVVRWEG